MKKPEEHGLLVFFSFSKLFFNLSDYLSNIYSFVAFLYMFQDLWSFVIVRVTTFFFIVSTMFLCKDRSNQNTRNIPTCIHTFECIYFLQAQSNIKTRNIPVCNMSQQTSYRFKINRSSVCQIVGTEHKGALTPVWHFKSIRDLLAWQNSSNTQRLIIYNNWQSQW